MKHFQFIGIIIIGLFCFSAQSFGQDTGPDGNALFQKKLCHTCHGKTGKTPYPNYPNLAGHDALYIVNQFSDIQAKLRNNGLTLLMNVFPTVKTISRSEIFKIADHLSKLPD